ncbi:uncharacterized protein PITG_02680 [Phytophthora infestans T30-4]|uniref:Uncharacterized protein n=1 Tax=Phytophthora infestans (strain T30-4) TaxID=403677 RepID=D0MWY7_PHYIT|nr:uncharacterized protein PITG_02680 [Phytophthora infestans T30-4]EEY64150.1 conserved hypothetical protein [Phytophthora infestans T30-4]|eukprot:XP_002907586.1 conserved hypothetical protein [Phytophthora infestans T30-4]
MLQESLGGGGDSATSTKRAQAQVQKLLQLASVRPNALTLREYREGLEECLKPEGIPAMKILGFQLAGIGPGCSTHEVWKFIMEAVVNELGSSENTSALAAAIPVLRQVPLPLVLGFLLTPEREPMNKLRSILTHEDIEVHCNAITTLSQLTLDVAINVAGDGLFVFPFESHEARICCQQDLETMVNDCWKLIFHTLSFDGQSQSAPWAAGTAFTALTSLFARSSTMAPFFPSIQESLRVQAPIDDVTSVVYKQAFPRIRALIATARSLPMKQQPDAMLWISMLLYTMMERSGARCPSVSVPYMEIDTEDNNIEDGDDDDAPHASTEPVRVDELVRGLLESWAFPTVSRRVSLAQATNMCRAIFILLAHPLQTFTRMRWAAQLANHLIAQCYLANRSNNNGVSSSELKLELCGMLVKTFAWLSGVNCQSLFVRTTEAIYLLDHDKDRRDLVQTLMDTIVEHVVVNRDFQLLQGLCTMAFFRQPRGFSRLSPRTNGSEVFRALFQALSNTIELSSPPRRNVEHQISQLIALRVFRGLLLLKLGGSATTSPKAYLRSCEMSENIVYYTGLLTSHFQDMLACPELALRESLDFFQQELLPTMAQIASQCARLQILWIGVRLHRNYSTHVPFDALVRELQCETGRLFTAIWNDDDEMEGATFDDGLLGAGVEEIPGSRERAGDANNVDALMVIGDCITLLAQLQPQTQPQFLQLCEKMIATLSAAGSPPAITSQQYRVIEDVMAQLSTPPTNLASAPETHFSKEIFDPRDIFLPRKHVEDMDRPNDEEYREPITVSGSSDPVSIRISHHHFLSKKEDVVTLDVSCCNLTTWALSDLEIQFRPLGGVGVVQCVDTSKDLKLRMLRSGETVSVGTSGGCTSLPPFGVIKAQKKFRVCKFTQVTLLLQAVLVQDPSQDGDTMGDIPAEETSPTPIYLAFSDRYVLHFDTLLRLPQPQIATGSFFRHCWQSANSGVLWRVKAPESKAQKLGACQHALHVMNAKLAVVSELLLDLPMHFHIAMVTQTRWGSYITAVLTMTLESDSSWSGVLEVRSTSENIREFKKWPRDTTRLFSGDHVRLCNDPVPQREPVHTSTPLSNAANTAAPLPTAPSPFDDAFSTPVPAPMQPIDRPMSSAASTFTPDVRSTTSFHKDVSVPTDRSMSSFARSQPEQMRAPETTPASDEQWGNFL